MRAAVCPVGSTNPAVSTSSPEILFVKIASENGFHDSLQIEECKCFRHQLENHRPVFEFSSKSAHSRSQNTTMVEHHLPSKRRQSRPLFRRWSSIPARLGDESGLIHEFVAIQNLLVIPRNGLTKAHAEPVHAGQRAARSAGRFRLRRPLLKSGLNLVRKDFRLAIAPILPREVSIPRTPFNPIAPGRLLVASESQITDGNDVKPFISRPGVPSAVAKSIQLFHIAQINAGLISNPIAKPDLQGSMF